MDFPKKISMLGLPENLGKLYLPILGNHSFLKMGHPRPLFHLFSSFQATLQFLKQINVKKCHVHPVSGVGIRTHDLWNVSLLP